MTGPMANPPSPSVSSHSASGRIRHGRDLHRRTDRRVAAAALAASLARQVFYASYHQGRPTRLMAGSQSMTVVAVKELVEQDQIAPRGIRCVSRVIAVNGTPTMRVGQEDGDQSSLNFPGHFAERFVLPGSRRALDFQRIAIEVVVALERLDQQMIERKPDRSAPIRVAAEQLRLRIAWLIVDPVAGAARIQIERVLSMNP